MGRPKTENRFLGREEPRSPVALPKRRQAKLATRRATGVDGLAIPDHVVSDGGQKSRVELYATANSHYREMNRSWTLTWLRHRMREYVNIHGYASSGVCALLERAAEQYADSDYLRATAASKGDPDPTSLKQASQHAANARSHELAAWELAAREGVMRRQLGEQDEKVSKLARELNRETTSTEPMTWDGGITGADVDAGAIEQMRSPFTQGENEPGSMTQVKSDPWVKPDPVGVGGQMGEPVPPFASPPGSISRGTPFPPNASKTDSPSSPPPEPPAPKPQLYTYCERCCRNFRPNAGSPHCPRCGVLPIAESATPIASPESYSGTEDAT